MKKVIKVRYKHKQDKFFTRWHSVTYIDDILHIASIHKSDEQCATEKNTCDVLSMFDKAMENGQLSEYEFSVSKL